MDNRSVVTALFNSFDDILTDRMHENDDNFIRSALLNSVSPLVKIDYHNGIVLYINSDDYGLNETIRSAHDYGDQASIYIDGVDIFDWD